MRNPLSQRFAIVALLLLSGAAFALGPARPGKTEVSALVQEYTNDGTSEERRGQVLKSLRLAESKVLARAVANAIEAEATRAVALDLAFALELAGLYKDVKGFVNSPLEEKVIRAIFQSGEKDAEQFLFERWSEKPPESASHKIVDAGFRTYFVSRKSVERFHDVFAEEKTPEVLKNEAQQILKHQMVLSDEETQAIGTGWKGLFAQFELRTRDFAIEGENLLERDGWDKEDIIGYRDRYILPRLSSLRLSGVTLQNFTMRAWVMVLEGDGASAGIVMKKGNSFLGGHFGEGLWHSRIAGKTTSVPGQVGAWTEFVFKIRGSEISVSVDGVPFIQQSGANYGNEAGGVQFGAGSKGRMIVGAVSFQSI